MEIRQEQRQSEAVADQIYSPLEESWPFIRKAEVL